jgi:hypothetical protein
MPVRIMMLGSGTAAVEKVSTTLVMLVLELASEDDSWKLDSTWMED